MSASASATLASAPSRRRWWQRPGTVLGLLATVAALWVLFRLGTRSLSFRSEVAPDGSTNWDWAYAWDITPLMLDAMAVTATATILGFAVAIVLGLLLALGRRSSNRLLSWPLATIIEFVRSTPLLIQLYFLYYALPDLGVVLSPLTALVVGLGIHYATYCSEAYRAGINSVPAGQWEAATAMNLGPALTWTRVILPQAVPNVVPALGNFLIAGFKDAPLGAAVQVTTVLFFATTLVGRDFRPVEPMLLMGVGFLLVSLPAAWLVRRLEDRVGYERT